MNLGSFRKLTEGMPDSTPLTSFLMSSCSTDEELNVVVEDIAPSADRSRVNINISIVTDDQLREREDESNGSLASGEDLIDAEREIKERTGQVLAQAETLAASTTREQALAGMSEVCGTNNGSVLFRLDSDSFHDVDDIPMLDDARHAYFCAIGDDEEHADSPWSNVLTEEEAEESGDVNVYGRTFFAFDRDLTPDQQYAAIRSYLGLDGPPPVQPS